MIYPTIFKLDSVGKTRFWQMEIHDNGTQHRTISGIHPDGTPVVTGWTTCNGKQGRSDTQQATFEVEAKYKHQLEREYHSDIATIAKPKFFAPMLAHKYESVSFPVYSQPKLDGIRCIANKDGLFSREGKPIYGVPHIWDALASEFEQYPTLVLDGELYNHAFREDFGAISSIVRKASPNAEQLAKSAELIEYHVYDLPTMVDTFEYRSQALEQIITRIGDDMIKFVPTHMAFDAGLLDAFYGEYLVAGYEGQMVRLNKPYEQKRSKTLLKRKEFMDAEFEVVSIDEGNGNWAGLAKRVTCKLPDGRTFGAGIKGNATRAAELLNEDHKVVTVQYFQLSPDGVPRFPVVTKFHGAERTL